MRIEPIELLIQALDDLRPFYLADSIRMPKEEVYEFLQKLTGQDFGYDQEAWRKWYRENKYTMRRNRHSKDLGQSENPPDEK